jgi:hypothetical protein
MGENKSGDVSGNWNQWPRGAPAPVPHYVLPPQIPIERKAIKPKRSDDLGAQKSSEWDATGTNCHLYYV